MTMNSDERGLRVLWRVAEHVAAGLERPHSPHAWLRGRRAAAAVAAVLALVAGLVVVTTRMAPDQGVEVLVLRIHGRDVPARVMRQPGAGATVVRPMPRSGARLALVPGGSP